MNFKLKALVAAAVATMTMSGAVNALTNNEIFLVASDTTGSTTKTFIAALGGAGSVTAFTGNSNLSINYAADANWTNFISGTTNVSYQVLGINVGNSATAGSYTATDKLLVSANSVPGGFTNNQMSLLIGSANASSGTIGGFEFLNAAITGTSTGLVTGGGADGIGAVKTNFFGQYPNVNTVASLGADLGFYAITRPATTGGLNQQVKTQFLQDSSTAGDVWNLSASGLLTYTTASVAAVPEADTSAMMLAGLGLMGFVARRRRA